MLKTEDQTGRELISQAIYRNGLNLPRIVKCVDMLTEEELWKHPNGSSNSIGNLILHLNGNITQYIISALGSSPDLRERDLEFSSDRVLDASGLKELITSATHTAASVLEKLDNTQLNYTYEVQGHVMSGIAIIFHVSEHYSYHTGQIVFLTKLLKDVDTGFYNGMDLNKKNSPT